jgi:Uncharacterized conserved protein
MMYISIAPYGNAFKEEPNGQCGKKDYEDQNTRVWKKKFEANSLCYPGCPTYTGKSQAKTPSSTTPSLSQCEPSFQPLSGNSIMRPTFFSSVKNAKASDTRRGTPVANTGMIWFGWANSLFAALVIKL